MSLEASEWNKRYLDLIGKLCAPAPGALDWFLDLLDVALVWDHFVDRESGDADVVMADRIFESMLTSWPLNPWWRANQVAMVPTLAAAISAWRYSNLPGAPKCKAYDIYTEVPAAMALIIYGPAKSHEILLAIRECSLHRMTEDDNEDGGKK